MLLDLEVHRRRYADGSHRIQIGVFTEEVPQLLLRLVGDPGQIEPLPALLRQLDGHGDPFGSGAPSAASIKQRLARDARTVTASVSR